MYWWITVPSIIKQTWLPQACICTHHGYVGVNNCSTSGGMTCYCAGITIRLWNGSDFGDSECVAHDDVIKWKHFPRYWPFVRGIHRLPVNSPHKGQGRGALMFSLICTSTNGWANNRDAGGLRRHRANYNVTAMVTRFGIQCLLQHRISVELNLKVKSCEISFAHNLFLSGSIALQLCAEHVNDMAVQCANSQNDSIIGMDVMEKRDFARFGFKMGAGRISDILILTPSQSQNQGWI